MWFFLISLQHGVFVEFCRHESCGCNSEIYCSNLKLVSLWYDFFLSVQLDTHVFLVAPQFMNLVPCCILGKYPESFCCFQVVPFSTFIHHGEAKWMKMLLRSEKNNIFCDNNCSRLFSLEEKSYSPSKRRILISEDLGFVLLGHLKVSNC